MYIIDTNAVVDIYDRYYCSDIFIELFKDLAAIIAQNKLFICAEVLSEIESNLREDSFREFSELNIPCLSEDQNYQKSLGEIANYLHENYREKLVREFTRGADDKLIAHAVSHEKIIITNERGQFNTNSKLYIPATANSLNAQAIDTVEFFRREGLKY